MALKNKSVSLNYTNGSFLDSRTLDRRRGSALRDEPKGSPVNKHR